MTCTAGVCESLHAAPAASCTSDVTVLPLHVRVYICVYIGAFRAEAPFAFTGTAQEAYALMDQHTVKLTEKEAQVSSECR